MPEPHRFSGQTYGGTPAAASSALAKPVNIENHHKVGMIIMGGGLILIAALFYFGYTLFIKPYLSPKPLANTSNVVSSQTPAISDVKKVEAVKPVEVIPPSNPIISTSTAVQATTTDIVFPEETPVVSVAMPVSTVDSDADGLTDAEEKIIGTDPNKADTDNDGYLDLAELKSGYDPLVPGKKISETSSMYAYQVDSKMSLIYPASWNVTKSTTDSAVVFADSDKALIQVNSDNNSTKLLPSVWFAQQFPGTNPGESISGQDWQGFYSKDGLAAYIFNKDFSKIYSFECSPLTSDNSSVTIFHLMIKTLIIK